MQIVDDQTPPATGSGVIIRRSGNSYTVLTAYHVVKEGKKYQVITHDQQSYTVNNVKHLQGLDLALVEFSSSKPYNVAKIGDSDLATATTTVYVGGFPAKTAAISNPYFSFNKGQVNANGAAQRDGYNLIYENKTLNGMSGGPVLNEKGELVGVHGRADEQEIAIGTTINVALQKMVAVGVDVGGRSYTRNSTLPTAPKADDFFIKAYDSYRNKDYQGAIANYTQAIRLNPRYANAYYNRGIARSDIGDKQGAIADYTQTVKINPRHDDAYYNRGLVYYELKNYQAAIADYNESLKINPNAEDAYLNRGLARYELGDKQGAITDYNQALKINPKYANAYLNRGLTRADLGDRQGAIADYNQALKYKPDYDKAYYNRGIAYFDLKNLQQALADFNQAIKINSKYANAYYNRALTRRDLGDKKGALADFKQAAELYRQQNNNNYYEDTLIQIRKLEQ